MRRSLSQTWSSHALTDAMSEGAVGVRGTKTSFSGRGARLHSSEPSRRPLRVLVFSKHEKCVEMSTVENTKKRETDAQNRYRSFTIALQHTVLNS